MAQIDTLSPADLGALAWLAARSLDHDDLSADLLRRRLFEDPDHDPRYSLCARRGDRLLGAAVGVIRARKEGPVGYVRLVATDPDARRQGLASALLAELESRLAADGAIRVDVGTETPTWLFAGVEVCYTAALCFFQRRGYVRTRDTYNLSVDLVAGDFRTSEREAALRGQGIVVRRLEPSDRPSFDRYLAANWGESWHQEGLSALDTSPATGFVALRGGEIAGFAVYDVSRPGWFGPIGVDATLRGQGVGTILLYRCLQDWQAAGRRSAEICWIGPMHFYSIAADARVCRVFWQMRKDLAGR